MKQISIILYLTINAVVGIAAPESMDELEAVFPPIEVFDHSAALLAKTNGYPSEVMLTTVKKVSGMPFSQCLSLDLKKPGSSPYAVNLQFFEPNQWQQGDAGLIAFSCRTLQTSNPYGASSLKIQYKPSYDDWRGHKETDLYLTKGWKLVLIPFEIKIDAPDTPKTVLNFFLGGVDPHVFQLADLKVYRYGKKLSMDELPLSQAYYPGMEPDAEWRIAANKRIESTRKANLKLTIKDKSGNPVESAKVHIQLNRHQFGFGAAINTPKLVSPDIPANDRKKYSDILTRTCSKITPTNAMKWRLYSHFNQHVPAMIDWCMEHDMTLRGHLFIWPGFERLPEGYDLYKTDPAAFRKDLTDHISEFANLFPNAFSEWDVMNEPYTEHDYMDLLGKDVVLEWFETARKANPTYLNYINDYGILSDNNAEHRDNYFEWISYLVDHNAPLDGIGFQGHFRTATPPELILERIDRYATFGKKMQITEFDFDHTNPNLQARFFEDFITLIYSHPQMSALINWIYLEDNFRPNAAVYRKDFTPTAMGKVWERLLTKQWHTEESLTTDEHGHISVRGFKGTYEVNITHEGESTTQRLDLLDDAIVEIRL